MWKRNNTQSCNLKVIITKEDFNEQIEKSFNEGQSLESTITLLEHEFGRKLGSYDGLYVEDKYVELLIKYFLEEVPQQITKCINVNTLLEFINELDTLTSLDQCCDFVNQFYSRENENRQLLVLKQICKTSSKIRSHEKLYIHQFINQCYSLVHFKADCVSGELNFNKCLTELLKWSKNPVQLCQRLGLLPEVTKYFDNDLFVKDFLSNLLNRFECLNQVEYKLKQAAQLIINQDTFVLHKDINRTIEPYLKEAILREEHKDGRFLLEVSGKHIVISKVLGDIENKLRTSNLIEEVRFVNAGVVHVNENLNSSVWHGKNIVLVSETVIVSDDRNVIWDVSGKNATELDAGVEAGTGDDGSGMKGADGQNGESGGNILFIVGELKNGENLNIKSNGGRGGKGQDGGRGLNGGDGHFLEEQDFKELFPPVSKFINSKKTKNLETTKDTLLMSFQSVQKFYYGQIFLSDSLSKSEFDAYFSACISSMQNMYCELKTDTGCKVTFSFYYGDPIKEGCQSLLLHKGALGDEGKHGGSGGQGGRGGFAGEINILVDNTLPSDLALSSVPGSGGKPGKPGVDGSPGKKGADRGYVDYSRDITGNWPIYVIPTVSENSSLNIQYSEESSSERVFCAHNNLYAKIVYTKNEFIRHTMYRERANETASNHEMHVQRKKAIIADSIRNQYEQQFCGTDLFELNKFLEKVKDTVLELINGASLQTEQTTTELKVVRPVGYFNQTYHTSNTISSSKTEEEAQVDDSKNLCATELVKLIKNSQSDLHIWRELSQIRLNITQLQELWNIFNGVSFNEQLNKNIEIIFCNKYQLAVLEKLAQGFTDLPNISSANCLKHNEYLMEYFDKLLFISKEQEAVANTVEVFLLRDSLDIRKEALNIFRDKLESAATNRKVIKHMLMAFCNEFSHNAIVRKKLADVNELERNKEETLKTKLVSFKSALTRSKTKNIYDTLIKSIVIQTNEQKIMFENEIQTDKLFFLIYKAYVTSAKEIFQWEKVLTTESNENMEIVRFIFDTFIERGPFCAFYREFLAYHFDKNIIIYSRNENNNLIMIDNHNPKACTTAHFLIEEKQIIQLKMNNELVELLNSQIIQGRLFANILTHVDSFIEKHQFDEFLSQKSFESYWYKGVEKSMRIRVRITHIIMEEDNIKGILNAYSLSEEKDLIRCRLEKLKLEYTGCESIIYYMALHFDNEGTHISANELCVIINFILKCALNVPHMTSLLSWTVAAYPQTQWIVEVILLKVEFKFGKVIMPSTKSKWKEYLLEQTDRKLLMLMVEKISDDKITISVQNFEETIYLLSKIPQSYLGLEQLNFDDWKYYLKDKFWCYQLKPITHWSDDQLNSVAYYMMILENVVDTRFCNNFINVLKSHKNDLHSDSSKQIVHDILRIFTAKEVCLDDSLLQLLSGIQLCHWKAEISKRYFSSTEDRTLGCIVEIIKSTTSISDNVTNKLSIIIETIEQSDKIKNMLEKLDDDKFKKWVSKIIINNEEEKKSKLDRIKEYIEMPTITDETILNVGKNILKLFSTKRIPETNSLLMSKDTKADVSQDKTLSMIIAVVVTAVEKIFSFRIRATQKFAIVTMLTSNRNLLSQVATGEGKSIIIVIVAIVKALNGQKVDIITSSHVLAERDAKKYEPVYKLFDINVGHNYSENIEIRKNVYSNNNVVYGELANFQRDYLLDRIYNKNVLGDRMFEIVIVDEVDSMLLDKGNNTLYLSHEIPGLDKLEQVFTFIWISLNNSTTYTNKKNSVSELKQKVLYEIFGVVTKDDLKNLDSELDNEQVNKIFNILVKTRIISINGKILVKNCLFETLPETFLNKNHLKFLLRKILGRKKKITIPNYLNDFVESHLEEWIKSGIRAMSMEPGIDYVVDVDRSETSSDRSPNIIIIDRDTGTDLVNSQWEDGLHQFLQLKHGCRLSIISLKAVFISNVSYLKEYKMLFGLTGTIGTVNEQKLLEEIYEVDVIKIPTAKTKLFKEEESILCTSIDEWTSAIWENVFKKVNQNRSVLIICETLRDVMTVKKTFDQHARVLSPKKVHIYKRDYEEFTVAEALEPGHVIISTNLAGRGTDINLTEELCSAGGLHVCLSFFPTNNRIEEQAYGRAARKGERGSAQMIFKSCMEENPLNVTVIDLKKQRDVNESVRISDIKNYNKSYVQPQEKCLKQFVELYQEIDLEQEELKGVKEILLQVSLDQWAFWLEKNKNSRDLKLSSSLREHLRKLSCKEFANCIDDPSQLNKLGLILIENKKFDKALLLFDRVIKDEPSFSENARYYRLCAKLATEKLATEDIITELNLIVKLIKERIQSVLLSANIIDYLKKENPLNILQIESFKEQHQNICRIYEVFLDHINCIIGCGFSFESFAIPTIIDEECASRIYKDLISENIIAGPEVKGDISEEDLAFVSQYGLIPNELRCVLEGFKEVELNEQQLIKELKHLNLLPSRELFWKELLIKRVLVNEEKYSIVDLHKLNSVDPSLVNVVEPLSIPNHLDEDNEIWLYKLEEIDCFDEKKLILTKKELLQEEIGINKYKVLKHKYVIYPNKQAKLIRTQVHVELNYFDCLRKEDFVRVNISNEIAFEIIHELKKQLVIQEISNDKYILLINPRDIASIKLSRFSAYSEEVVNLLSRCFAFRLALQKTWELLDNLMNSDDPLCLPLQIRLQKRIVEDFFDHGIVIKSVVKPNQEQCISKALKRLYPKALTMDQLDSLFSDTFELSSTRNNIIQCLIEKKWFIEFKEYNLLENIKNKFTKRYVFHQQETFEELPSTLQKYSETIQLVLNRHLNLSDSQLQIYVNQFLHQHASRIYGLESLSWSLIPVHDILKERKLPLGECSIFTLNGFDKIVILEELKYSRYMLISTFVVAMIGVVEITVGALYGIPKIVEGGVADLNFVISCLFSGHFSWKEYGLNKITNIAYDACNSVFATGKFTSNFGQKLSLSSMWGVVERSQIKTVAWQIVRYSTTTCIVAASYAAIDKFIEPKLYELQKKLVESSVTDIDNIVNYHPVVEVVKNTYLYLGKEKSTKHVKLTSSMVMEDYKSKNDKNLLMLFGKLHTNITTSINYLIREFNMKKMSWTDLITLLHNAQNIIENVSELIHCIDYFKNLQSETTTIKILNSLQHTLEKNVNESRVEMESDNFDADNFVSEILKDWKIKIREVYSYNINRCIILPLLSFLKNTLVGFLAHKNNLQFVSDFKHKGLTKLSVSNKVKLQEDFKLLKNSKDCNFFLCAEYDDCLTHIFTAKKQSVQVFLEILRNSFTADKDFITKICSVVPMALKRRGLNLPLLQIIIESDTIQQISANNATLDSNVMTLTISPNHRFLTHLARNKIVLEDIFDALYQSILQIYPQFSGYDGQYVRNLIAEVIEEDYCILQHIGSKEHNSVSFENTDFSLNSGRWEKYCTTIDIDHRKMEPTLQLDKMKECITEGFKTALDKINRHLYSNHHFFKYFKLSLEDFIETGHEIIPCNQFSECYFSCYATKYELTVPLKSENISQLVDYNITMSLNTCPDWNKSHSPNGPHILYKMNPSEIFWNKPLDKVSFEGHVLLNFEHEETIYRVKDCHLVDELDLPSFSRFHS